MKSIHHLILLLAVLVTDALGQQSNPLRINCPPNRTNWTCGVASTVSSPGATSCFG